MPVYRFRVTPDVTEQEVLVTFLDDAEACKQASPILEGLLMKAGRQPRRFRQKIEVFREDGSILMSILT